MSLFPYTCDTPRLFGLMGEVSQGNLVLLQGLISNHYIKTIMVMYSPIVSYIILPILTPCVPYKAQYEDNNPHK